MIKNSSNNPYKLDLNMNNKKVKTEMILNIAKIIIKKELDLLVLIFLIVITQSSLKSCKSINIVIPF
jgi:oligoribonuclease (3'-5' exoribonuclease)